MNEFSAALHEIAAPADRGEKIQTIIARVARATGLKPSRVYEAWYGRARRISDDERLRVAQALQKKREQDARNELQSLRLRIEILESRLRAGDADFHCATLAALRHSVRGRG